MQHLNSDECFLQEFAVRYRYPVLFGQNLLAPQNSQFAEVLSKITEGKPARIFTVIDKGVSEAWPSLFENIQTYCSHFDNLDFKNVNLEVVGGEECKNDPAVLLQVYDWMAANNIDRQSYILAIGGGAVLDLVGYACATVHRGIRLIRMPTTVLAQNDAGVGVKNSVNFAGQKNFLGTFAPPDLILVDGSFLRTLSKRDAVAGLAEAVKVALVKDKEFYQWLKINSGDLAKRSLPVLSQSIRHCAVLHMQHIATSSDAFERSSSRPLDFGHWAAHRLEVLTENELRHGEAVAIGIMLDLFYSVKHCGLNVEKLNEVYDLFSRLGFQLWHPALELKGQDGTFLLMAGLEQFREHMGGELTLIMLSDISKIEIINSVEVGTVLEAIVWLKSRQ